MQGARLGPQLAAIAASLKAGDYRQAIARTREAASLPPATPMELVELARRLVQFNLSGDLRELVAGLLKAKVGNAAAEADVAALLSMLGDQEQAGHLLERAMARLGPHPPHLYNRSQIRLYAGRLDEAERDLRDALARDPAMAKAHWALSKLPAGATAADIAAAERLLARVPSGSMDEAYLGHALFNQYDRKVDSDPAWERLRRGAGARRALLDYRPEHSARLFDAIEAAFPPGSAPPRAATTAGAPTPVFIVGMHRSGTTLLERMLGNHSQVAEGGELYDLPAQLRLALGRHFNGPLDLATVQASAGFDAAAIGAGYRQQVRWRAGDSPLLVDKLPSNFLNVGFILRALPDARIVHMHRDPMDTCFSNFKELFGASACAYSYDFDELAHWYAGYRRVMAHWRQAFPGAVLDVSYEALARDPEGQGRRILAHCGLAWEPACLDAAGNTRAVNTASSAQVREPIHQRGIGAWRRYESALAPLREALRRHGVNEDAEPAATL